jgi:hypothetical protein
LAMPFLNGCSAISLARLAAPWSKRRKRWRFDFYL